MEWLNTATNDDLANQFYQAMFIKGLGEADAGTFISGLNIAFPKTITNNVKFEVSKGLAMESTTLMRPFNCDPIEVIGEGRDMTTVVFPNADYKFYLDASLDVQAQRRLRPETAV